MSLEPDLLIGCIILGAALALHVVLVIVSRRRIHTIAEKGSRTAREILKGSGSEGNGR
jgi:hypothetical protein